jgi:glycosyltransferase involved in cell wall biosynthesis
MPVYNGERYLRGALGSVREQTFADFELVAVDDGSTDASRKILESAARDDARIRVLSRPNTGIVGALNDGLHLCRADLVARMDCDDIAAPNRFRIQVDYMREHPECVAVGSRVLLIDSDGDPIRAWPCPLDHDSIDGAHLRGEGGAITHPSAVMRRAALEEIGGYRTECEPAEDLDLFLRLAERGRLANLPSVLLSWRMHLGSTGSTQRERQRNAAFRAVADACARRGLDPPSLDALPGRKEQTELTLRQKWTWWALAGGNIRTARKHAWASFVSEPLKRENWRLMACAIRGR